MLTTCQTRAQNYFRKTHIGIDFHEIQLTHPQLIEANLLNNCLHLWSVV